MSDAGQIKPQLKVFDLTMIVVGLVIGMGIFRTPTEVALKSGTTSIFFMVWILGAAVSFLGALTFAEIGSRFNAPGGFYKLFSHCYHPAFAFMVNWITVISNAASSAGVAIMGSEYLAPILLPQLQPEVASRIITITSVVLLFIVNFRGIRLSSKVLNVLMIIKLSLLVIVISSLVLLPDAPAAANLQPADPQPWWKAIALCFIPVFFTYGGYQQTLNFGGDVTNVSKTFPRAIFYGMLIVLCTYLLANYAYVHSLGFTGVQNSKTIAADICGLMFGKSAYYLVSVIMFFSVLAYLNVSIMSNPRIYYAMAQDGVMPGILAKVNPRTQVQEWALILFCLFILITLFFLSSFQHILQFVMFFDSISLIAAASAIFVLRAREKKAGTASGIFKMRGYPYLPAVYIVVYMAVNISVLASNPTAFGWGAALFAAGLPLYFILKKVVKREGA